MSKTDIVNKQSIQKMSGVSTPWNQLILSNRDQHEDVITTENSEEQYKNAISTVRKLLTKEDSADLVAILESDEIKKIIKAQIVEYIKQEAIKVEGYNDPGKLAEKMFNDITGLAFLETYLVDPEVEEINGLSWDNIEVKYKWGTKKIDEKFSSPSHAMDIIQKMVEFGGKNLNGETPSVDSFIGVGLRITAFRVPLVDLNIGCVFSLRKQRATSFLREELINFGTCTGDQYDLAKACFNSKMSIFCGGETNSGKTGFLNAVLSDIAKDGKKKIISMEEDTRELDFIHRDETGQVISRVIHTKTRRSDIGKRDVSPQRVLKGLLRMSPDIIAAAEMRGEEAMIAQESARTGHSIGTTGHVNNAVDAYERIATMCNMSEQRLPINIMIGMVTKAFPISIYFELLEDGSRKIMEIFECVGYDANTNQIEGRMLYEFIKTGKTEDSEGKVIRVEGDHIKLADITDTLADRLFNKGGYSIEFIKRFASIDWKPNNRKKDRVLNYKHV